MSTISQGAGDVRTRAKQSLPGVFVFTSVLNAALTALNQDPQAVQVDTITVDTATNDTLYQYTVNGVVISFTSDSSATDVEIAIGLAAAHNAEPLVRGEVSASPAAAVVTISGNTAGLAYTISENDTRLSLASVSSAVVADAVAFARLVVDDGLNQSVDQLAKVAKATGFTAQVVTQTVIFVTGATYLVTIRDDAGAVIAQGETAADTNTSDTVDAIAATMNGLLPANSVLAAGAATVVTFTAELAGLGFSVSIGTNELGQAGGALLAQTDTISAATSVNAAAIGITMHSSNDPTLTIGGTEGVYAPNAGMRVANKGQLWVDTTETIAQGEAVFVELTVAADLGKLFNTDSATRVRLTGAIWAKPGRTASDNLAAVDINFERPS